MLRLLILWVIDGVAMLITIGLLPGVGAVLRILLQGAAITLESIMRDIGL